MVWWQWSRRLAFLGAFGRRDSRAASPFQPVVLKRQKRRSGLFSGAWGPGLRDEKDLAIGLIIQNQAVRDMRMPVQNIISPIFPSVVVQVAVHNLCIGG